MRQRRKRKKQRKLIILSLITSLFVMTIGYAAFQTNLNINVKGNIKYKTNFYVSTTGSDETGTGSKTQPYQTIQKAYDMAKTEATIHVMTDLEINTKIDFNQNKNITLTSDNETNKINSLIRKNELSFLLEITNGETTIENIIFDGKNIEANGPLLRVANTNTVLNINEGSIFQNNIDKIDKGGGIVVIRTTLNINGGKIINNTAVVGGGGGIIANYSQITINSGEISGNKGINGAGIFIAGKDSNLIINNGKIINNTATNGSGGGITTSSATTIMNGGEISNNTSSNFAGGVYMNNWAYDKDIKGTFIMKGGTITNNTAANGGGIYVNTMGNYEYHNGTITNNSPNNIVNVSS